MQRWLAHWNRRSVSQLKLEQTAAASSDASPQSSVPKMKSGKQIRRPLRLTKDLNIYRRKDLT